LQVLMPQLVRAAMPHSGKAPRTVSIQMQGRGKSIMRHFWNSVAIAAGMLVVVDASSAQVAQEQNLEKQQKGKAVQQEVQKQNERSIVGQVDDKTSGSMIRASELIGMNIQNSKSGEVGEVEDVVLDADTGQIKYIAVTYGGFLGLGDKLFAVPYEAFKARRNPDDRDEVVLMLDVTEQQLEGAQGFDQDNWPDFADAEFTSELDKRYGIERTRRQTARPDLERSDTEGPDVDIDVDTRRERE
jgi:sporulation protein YlmC with PRC-barrel domain